MAAILKMATNAIKNNYILMIIKTMLSAVIDTLSLTVIHIRIHLFKYISVKKFATKMAAILSIDWQKGSNCLSAYFYISTNIKISTNILHQVVLLKNEFLINNYIISQQTRHVETIML